MEKMSEELYNRSHEKEFNFSPNTIYVKVNQLKHMYCALKANLRHQIKNAHSTCVEFLAIVQASISQCEKCDFVACNKYTIQIII